MALIFISHSSKDKDISSKIKDQIEDAGFDSVFLDHDVDKGIRTGEQWEQRLYDEMRASHILLILLSPAWAESKWCFAEYTHAKSSGKEIIPLIIEQDTPQNMSKWITHIQFADASNDTEARQRVIERIQELSIETAEGLEWDKGRSPYPGMIAFEESDGAIFFGRDAESRKAIISLKKMRSFDDPKSLMIVGASGMGKSSLLKAGIIPRLKRSYKNEWRVLPILTPSKSTLSDLVKILKEYLGKDTDYEAKLCIALQNDDYKKVLDSVILEMSYREDSRHSSLLLPIDQAENIYTASKQKDREFFLRALEYLLIHCRNLFSVWTLRSDFLNQFQNDNYMTYIVKSSSQFILTHIESKNIADIITKPANKVGLKIDSPLIEQIKKDMKTSDALPLVALVLSELYHKQKDNNSPIIILDTYQNLSKTTNNPLESIIQQTAEEAIADYTDEPSLKALKDAFIPHLVRINEAKQYIKRVAKWSELPKNSHKAINALIKARLLIKYSHKNDSEIYVEVSHEALIRKWSLLQKWLEEEQEFLIGKSQLEQSLSEYDKADDKQKSKAYLTGLRLQKASKWLEENFNQLSEDEREYISKSIDYDKKVGENLKQLAKDAKEEAKKAKYHLQLALKRRKWLIWSFIIILLFGIFASWQWMESQKSLMKSEHNIGLVLVEKAKVNTEDKSFVLSSYYAYQSLNRLNRDYDTRAIMTGLILPHADYPKLLSTLKGHTQFVNSVVLSRDGNTIISGSLDKTIKIWDKNSGKLLSIFKEHTNSVTSVALSTDGNTIISGSRDNTIKVWDRKSGQLFVTLKGHARGVESVALSTDGNTIISGSLDRTIKAWDRKSGKLLSTLKGHTSVVNSVALSTDSNTIISGSSDKTIKVWDRKSGKLLSTLKGHTGGVNSVALSNDSNTIISGSSDKTIKVWDRKSETLLSTLKGHTSSVNSVVLSTDGNTIISGSNDMTIKVWDKNSGKLLSTFKGHKYHINSMALSTDGNTIISGSRDNTIKVWNKKSKKLISTLKGHRSYVKGVALSTDGNIIISGSSDKTIKVWDRKSGKLLSTLKGHKYSINNVALSTDGNIIISSSRNNTIKVWDRKSAKLLSTLKGDTHNIMSIALSSDGNTIISGSSDQTIKVWDRKSARLLSTLKGHRNPVALSSDGNTIISGSRDKTIKVWDRKSETLLSTLKGHTESVNSVALSTDGNTIISSSWDNIIKVWETKSGKLLSTLKGSTSFTNCVALSNDGNTIISGSNNGTFNVWDRKSGKLLSTLKGHTTPVNSIALSTDGNTIISGSADNTIKILDISQLRKLQDPNYIKQQIKSLENQLQMKLDGVMLVPLDKK